MQSLGVSDALGRPAARNTENVGRWRTRPSAAISSFRCIPTYASSKRCGCAATSQLFMARNPFLFGGITVAILQIRSAASKPTRHGSLFQGFLSLRASSPGPGLRSVCYVSISFALPIFMYAPTMMTIPPTTRKMARGRLVPFIQIEPSPTSAKPSTICRMWVTSEPCAADGFGRLARWALGLAREVVGFDAGEDAAFSGS